MPLLLDDEPQNYVDEGKRRKENNKKNEERLNNIRRDIKRSKRN
jgi:hypothetical protein